jgi:nitroimidazol reductase NimA-like FMN-containing flavoprotein (pyridoxamine 5'-phosphate oxidase superfamily)
MPSLRELDRDRCLDLIARGTIGRIAVTAPDGPHIVPVNFTLVEDTVAIRTTAYSVVGTYARDSVVAFEVDHLEHETRAAWSVVVRGRCFVESDPQMLARLRSELADSWAGGARTLYLRIPLEHVSGRAVGGAVSLPRSDAR